MKHVRNEQMLRHTPYSLEENAQILELFGLRKTQVDEFDAIVSTDMPYLFVVIPSQPYDKQADTFTLAYRRGEVVPICSTKFVDAIVTTSVQRYRHDALYQRIEHKRRIIGTTTLFLASDWGAKKSVYLQISRSKSNS